MTKKPQTILDALSNALIEAGAYNKGTMQAPAAILWTDEKREWESLIVRLKARFDALYTLGDYDPSARTGPAIWLKCVLSGTVPGTVKTTSDEVDEAGSPIPIFYLPNVNHAKLRAVDNCPTYLKPLTELQYHNIIWNQINHRN